MKYKCVINEKLEELLEKRGISMTKLSNDAHIPYCRVVSWKFKNNPHVTPDLMACAEYFRVPLSYLLYGYWDLPYKQDKTLKTIEGNNFV